MSSDLLRNAVRITIVRDLEALEREIEAYPDDESLWLTPPGISNSAGNLALHLAGNLRHFIGATLASTGYVRDRDAEFAKKGLSRAQLIEEVRAAVSELQQAFDKIDDETIESVFPLPVGPQAKRVRTSDWLVHLAVHFTYHLGQIDYHRRLLTSGGKTVDTISLKEIPEIDA
jgi:uncharacterized damage-inducible protein DinB